MKRFFAILLIGLALAFSWDRGWGQPFFDPPPPREKIERIQKQIEMVRMWRLTKELDLDEEGAARVFPILSRYDKKRMDLEVERFRIMRELRETINDDRDRDNERRVEKLMDRLESNKSAMDRLQDAEREELKKVLTRRQMAKYIIFQQRFEHEMKEIIREHRRERFPERNRLR